VEVIVADDACGGRTGLIARKAAIGMATEAGTKGGDALDVVAAWRVAQRG
jgi:hypothetical protein